MSAPASTTIAVQPWVACVLDEKRRRARRALIGPDLYFPDYARVDPFDSSLLRNGEKSVMIHSSQLRPSSPARPQARVLEFKTPPAPAPKQPEAKQPQAKQPEPTSAQAQANAAEAASKGVQGSFPRPNFLVTAKKFIGWGGYVMYCQEGKKFGMPDGWQNMATRDLAQAELWAQEDPHRNCILVGKPDGLLSFDSDADTLARYEAEHGKVKTTRQRSVSGGTHLIFKQTDATRAFGNFKKTDSEGGELWSVRADNMYIQAFGSTAHPNNDAGLPLAQYELVDDIEPIEMPQEFLNFLRADANLSAEPRPPVVPIGTVEQEAVAAKIETVLYASGKNFKERREYQQGFKWLNDCPWTENHTWTTKLVDQGGSCSAVIMLPNGEVFYECKHNNCQKKTWADFCEYARQEANKEADAAGKPREELPRFGAYVGSVPAGKTTQDVAQVQADAAAEASKDVKSSFPTLVPVEDKLSPVLPFDPDFLPDSIKPWLVDVAERMSVPLDFTGICGLTGLAGVTGRRVFIFPKQYDKEWKEPLNLCGGIVAASGQVKTPTWKAVLAPIQIVENTWEHAAQEEQIKYLQELQIWKAAEESWKNEVKEIRKRNKKAVVKETEPEEPLPPMEPIPARRLITTDATLEALHEMMSHNPAGILLLRDELSGWVAEQDKKGYEVAKSFHLTATNGNDYYAMDRIGRGSVKALVCESIFGGFQPDTFREWLACAQNLQDGMIPRFTLLAWPDEIPTKRVDRPANEAAKEMFYRVVRNIANSKPCALSLSFDQQAQTRYDAWYDELLVRIAKEKNSSKASYMSKLKGCLPRLAGLLQLIDMAAAASENDPRLLGEAKVDLRHLEKAISLSRYLESHMHRLYDSIRNPVQIAETELAEHLVAGDLEDEFTLRVVHRKRWTGLTVPDIVESALDRLEAKGWVASYENKIEKTRGRPTVWWKINPLVVGKTA